jgi:hypothetical protein
MRSQGKYQCTIKCVVLQLQQNGALGSLGVPRWSGSDAVVLMMHERSDSRRGRTEFLCHKSAAVPLRLPQIPHGLLGSNLLWSQRLTAWSMVWPVSSPERTYYLRLAAGTWQVVGFLSPDDMRTDCVILYIALIMRIAVLTELPNLCFIWSYKCTFFVHCCAMLCVCLWICVVFILC